MKTIPLKRRSEMSLDPYYKSCARQEARHDHDCEGRITWEHAIVHAGSKVQESWALVPLCEWAHSVNSCQDGGGLDKEVNVWLAINRATDDQLRQVSKVINYIRMREFLNKKYGKPAPFVPRESLAIAY